MAEGDEAGEATLHDARVDPEDLLVIDAYTRAEALRDGTLIDATDLAAEMGLTVPVALTHALWRRTVAMTLAAEAAGEDETGRLRNLLQGFRDAVRRSPAALTRSFSLPVVAGSQTPDLRTVKAVMGPGDQGEPVVTLMLPDED